MVSLDAIARLETLRRQFEQAADACLARAHRTDDDARRIAAAQAEVWALAAWSVASTIATLRHLEGH